MAQFTLTDMPEVLVFDGANVWVGTYGNQLIKL